VTDQTVCVTPWRSTKTQPASPSPSRVGATAAVAGAAMPSATTKATPIEARLGTGGHNPIGRPGLPESAPLELGKTGVTIE
jgi:hypothetical protein